MSNFKKAIRERFRWSGPKGLVNLEDLYSLPLSTVRKMANELHKKLKTSDDLFAVATKSEADDKVKLEILIEVVNDREADISERSLKLEKEQKAKRLKEIIASKRQEADNSKSIEDLEKELKELES